MILISGFMQRSNGSLPLSHGWHYLSQDKVQSELDARKEEVEVEVKVAEAKAAALKEQMADLKTKLYAKFGNAINLEAEEES